MNCQNPSRIRENSRMSLCQPIVQWSHMGQMGPMGQMCQNGQIGQMGQMGQVMVYVEGLGSTRFDSAKI